MHGYMDIDIQPVLRYMLDTDVEMFGKLRIDQTKFPFEYLEPDIFERKLDRALRGHFGSILQSAPQMYSLAH